jgi:hypothetical protein
MSRIPVILALLLIAMTATADLAHAGETKRYNITDDHRRVIGDIYDPGHGRRLQIRDKHRRIIGYIERDGDITDKRRRKVGEIEELIQ